MQLSDAAVNLEAGERAGCEQAEAVAELNEGVPDFVAWMTAYELGVVDDDRVRMRFEAMQRDAFYLTGAMQLTVLRRLQGERFGQTTSRLASPESFAGGVFAEVEAAIADSCN